MDSSQEFKPLRDGVHSSLITITRSVNTLANEDLQFQRTVHPSVATRLDQNTNRLLELANGVLKSAAKLVAQREPQLDDVDDVEIEWKGVVDVIDSLLEKSDTCLDEYTGLVKRKDAPTAEAGREIKRSKPAFDRLDWSLKRANILKPQNAFEHKTDNFESGPWRPAMTTKPHAQVPLETSLSTFTDDENHVQYKHPYEHEITTMQYPQQVFEAREPIPYLPIEKTKAVWVDTYEGVLEMLEELKQATEIAVDLEHHDYRTYRGLLSLMQLSTRAKDWIVDTLVPWRHKLEVLNEVFANPKIVKVLHGAFMDVVWLQRDLGLYVVGLFDTFHASDVLGYASKSLAFLLKKFADFDAAKKYQLADWRIRPLPDEMFYYARSDTHYLLYIYDMMRNELASLSVQDSPEGRPIDRVIQRSKEVSLQRYEHPWCDEESGAGNRGWYNTLLKSPTLYNGEQFAVYKAVHKWRDDVARQDDESTGFIMTQQVLSDIARIMPTDMKALWSLLEANARGLKARLGELFEVIQKARAKGANGPTMMEFFRQYSVGAAQTTIGDKPMIDVMEEDVEPLDMEELKSEYSQLWGDVALNSRLDGSAKAPPLNDQEMIPLYAFDFAAVKEELPEATAPPPKSAPQEAADVEMREEDEGFTLKAGRKRKANHVSEPNSEAESASEQEMDESEAAAAEQSDAADGEGEDAEAQAKRAARRQERKERKAAKQQAKREMKALKKVGDHKAAEQVMDDFRRSQRALRRAAKAKAAKAQKASAATSPEATGSPSAEAEESATPDQSASPEQSAASENQQQEKAQEEAEQPFDYTKASSVLHPSKANNNNTNDNSGGKGKRGKKNNKPAFDPYAKKSGDAPAGARKMNYERAGRTATFKK